jgi:hypothetical protein
MTNPWDISPVLPTGDDSEATIYLSIGAALTAWAQIENSLFMMFQELAYTKSFASEAAFGCVLSFETRMEMINAATRRALPPPATSETTKKLVKCLKDIGKLSSRRNEIAHGQVIRFGGPKSLGGKGCYLTHSFFDTRKMKFPKLSDRTEGMMSMWSYAYTSRQIDAYAHTFQNYGKTMHEIIQQIGLERDQKKKTSS